MRCTSQKVCSTSVTVVWVKSPDSPNFKLGKPSSSYQGVNKMSRMRCGYSSLLGESFWCSAVLFARCARRSWDTNPTLSWQEFAECEAPGLTWVKVQQGEPKDTQGIHGLVVLQEIQDPIWTNTREMFVKMEHPWKACKGQNFCCSCVGGYNPRHRQAELPDSAPRVENHPLKLEYEQS